MSKNSTVDKNPLLECGDCLIELKEGEGIEALDGSILCKECKAEEEQNEMLRENEGEDFVSPQELEEVYQAFAENQRDERLDSLEDN
jgi:hypothetical protein